MPLTNTPDRPLKKTPTFKRLWHMALQLWYHRQIIRRYKARPIKYKKAYHATVKELKAASSRYEHLDRLRKAVKEADQRDLTKAYAEISKFKRRIAELDHTVNRYRNFVASAARCRDAQVNDLPKAAEAFLKNEQNP